MIVIVVIAAIIIAWAVLTVLVLGICRGARRGDQAQRETTPSASRPDPHTAGNRSWRSPAGSAFSHVPRTAHRPGADRV
jgi:hypothetical protein